MSTLLKIQKLNAGYNGLKVLKDVNVDVSAGQMIALIGPNGAGKSTVIKSVFNIAKVYSGKILFNTDNRAIDITKKKTHELLKLGICYVSQGRINFRNLTVEENLIIGADAIHEKEHIQSRLKELYKRFPILKERKKELAYSLSGGQQQILAIARALMHKPKLLMLDEPSLGLSPILQKEIFGIISKLRDEGMAILIVEQNAKKAIEMADMTYLLEDGKVVLKGDKRILSHKKIKNVYLGGRY